MEAKKIIYLIYFLLLVVTSSFAQNEKLSIDYGLLKTTYSSNATIISKKEFKRIVKQNEIAFMEYSKGKSKIVIGNIIAIPSFLLLLISAQSYAEGNPPYTWQWIGGVSGSVIGTILYYSGKKNVLNSISIYNSAKQISLHINNKGYNLGISLNF